MAQNKDSDNLHDLNFIDELIRSGQLQQARIRIEARLERALSRHAPSLRRRLAEFCRRVGWQERAVRLLNPFVRQEGRKLFDVEPGDRIEYAANLTFLGAVPEALQILEEVDDRENPKAKLFRAFAHFSRWEYREAIPLLETYSAHPSLTPYERWVALVNLMSAYSNQRQYALLLPISDELLTHVAPGSLLWSNVLEIRADALINLDEFQEAKRCLDSITAGASSSGASYSLFVEKWRLVLDIRENGATRARMDRLVRLKEKALKERRWEVARDCDYQRALYSRNQTLARKLYFGTPYPSYRARIEDTCHIHVQPRETYLWRPLKGRPLALLDVPLARVIDRDESPLKPGQLPHRLLAALVADFYRPQRIGSLFSELFPYEHWHPEHSRRKTQQIVIRLRRWLELALPEVSLRGRKHFIHLDFEAPISLLVAPSILDDPMTKHRALLDSFKNGEALTLPELIERTGKSRRHLQREIANLIATGEIVADGATRSRRFRRVR